MVVHLSIDLVAHAVVDGKVGGRLPVILSVEMQPCTASMLVGPPNPNLGGARISEQEIRQRVARPLPRERECAACCVRIDRVERQAKEIAAELQMVHAALHE